MAHEIMGKRFIARSKPAWHSGSGLVVGVGEQSAPAPSCEGRGGAMTKGERRKQRKSARAAGIPFDRQGDRDAGAASFGETVAGYRARERWARNYDALNGAPEGESDR